MPVAFISLLIRVTSAGPILYWSDRIGRNNRTFKMPKFRSMRVGTPAVATHLLETPEKYYTPIGHLLRSTSLDELPQLWCIFKGDMSFVGPRPALYNQDDLIKMRTRFGVDQLSPGLTGWAQINGRDNIPLPQKVKLDVEYLNRANLSFDCLIIFQTVYSAVFRRDISHWRQQSPY